MGLLCVALRRLTLIVIFSFRGRDIQLKGDRLQELFDTALVDRDRYLLIPQQVLEQILSQLIYPYPRLSQNQNRMILN